MSPDSKCLAQAAQIAAPGAVGGAVSSGDSSGNDGLPALSLITGGARSGKSRLAERLAIATGRPRLYLATAQAFDDEMRDRIAQHLLDRGPDWTTLEAPLDLASALSTCRAEHVVLLDCATLWLSNLMLAERDIAFETTQLMDSLSACAAPVIMVSNEVGWGIVPDNRLGREFRDWQGRFNQIAAAQAGLVVGVMAGLPLVLKGKLPDGF